jgi:hypothetical protein
MPSYPPLLGACLCLALSIATTVGATERKVVGHGKEKEKEVVRDVECISERIPIIGEVEQVVLEPNGLVLEARVDTGATTSSIDAREIQPYERDGKPWVRFQVPQKKGKAASYDLPIARHVVIKRHGAEAVERPVVEFELRLGEMDQRSEFSLTDRSKFTFPVLLGRNFLNTRFLVDVSRKHQLKTPLKPAKKGTGK